MADLMSYLGADRTMTCLEALPKYTQKESGHRERHYHEDAPKNRCGLQLLLAGILHDLLSKLAVVTAHYLAGHGGFWATPVAMRAR